MHGPAPSLGSPAVAGPQRGPVYCFVGKVSLTNAASGNPNAIVGRLDTAVGVAVPLVQSGSVSHGTSSLAAVNHLEATLCGPLLFSGGQLALEVAYVSPGKSALTPGVSPLALVVLALMGLLPVSD